MTQEHLQSGLPDDTRALLEMARALAATCDLDRLLAMVVEYSMKLLNAERATLFLYDENTNELYTRIAEGVEGFRIPAGSGIAGAAAQTRTTINVPDAYADPRFNRDVDKQTGYRTRTILSCPLIDYENRLVGVLQVLNKRHGGFSPHNIAIAEALSAQAGVALQRARLLEEYLEKQRMEHALEIAHQVQQRLFPKTFPALKRFDIAGWNRPCDAIGGDCCDFLDLGDGRYSLILGDVTGHGIGPALVSCAARAMLRAISSRQYDVCNVIGQVNNLIAEDMVDNSFVTVFLGVLDDEAGKLTYFSAGQGPLLWYRAATGEVKTFGAGGIPLGIMPDFEFTPAQTVSMASGDIFCLLTDGFYEWENTHKEQMGRDRIMQVIQVHHQCCAHDILHAILNAVETFSAEAPQADDLTGIVIKMV
ncbi:MAG: SpoIIE family protein phosphatase [Sedimentisphaerales bacterium]|nr:SpoIIE family protein phosphatase [Sedimentisphaerales bacterium]